MRVGVGNCRFVEVPVLVEGSENFRAPGRRWIGSCRRVRRLGRCRRACADLAAAAAGCCRDCQCTGEGGDSSGNGNAFNQPVLARRAARSLEVSRL
jgi:hypothetical protein